MNVGSTLNAHQRCPVQQRGPQSLHRNPRRRRGGVQSAWDLTVTDCTFTGNQALGGDGGTKGEGGAILNWDGTVTITHSTFTNNLGRGGDGATGTEIVRGQLGYGIGGAIYNRWPDHRRRLHV